MYTYKLDRLARPTFINANDKIVINDWSRVCIAAQLFIMNSTMIVYRFKFGSLFNRDLASGVFLR